MRIYLNRRDLHKVLEEKYGKASFRLFYEESLKSWEERNDKKVQLLKEPPDLISQVLVIDDDN